MLFIVDYVYKNNPAVILQKTVHAESEYMAIICAKNSDIIVICAVPVSEAKGE